MDTYIVEFNRDGNVRSSQTFFLRDQQTVILETI